MDWNIDFNAYEIWRDIEMKENKELNGWELENIIDSSNIQEVHIHKTKQDYNTELLYFFYRILIIVVVLIVLFFIFKLYFNYQLNKIFN